LRLTLYWYGRWKPIDNGMRLTPRLACGAAYYFAVKGANTIPGAIYKATQRIKRSPESLERERESKLVTSTGINCHSPPVDCAGSPSQESIVEPAATGHAPYTETQRVAEKSKYEQD
jgi:hypothetical protein